MEPVLCVKVDGYQEENSLILVKLNDDDSLKSKFGCYCGDLNYRHLEDYIIVSEKYEDRVSECNWFRLYNKKIHQTALVGCKDGRDMTKLDLQQVTLNTNFKIKQPKVYQVHSDDDDDC